MKRHFLTLATIGAVLATIGAPTLHAADDTAADNPRAKRGERRAAGRDTARIGERRLSQFFAARLLVASKNQVELAQMAKEKAKNKPVADFAQTVIQEHRKLNEKLASVSPPWANRNTDSESRDQEKPRSDEPFNPKRDKRRPRADRNVTPALGARFLAHVHQIEREAASNHLKMTTEMLNRYEGQDFDMAFLGTQIGAHAWMLAELRALKDVGSSDFQEVVNDAAGKIESHLKRAKELARKFEDDRRGK